MKNILADLRHRLPFLWPSKDAGDGDACSANDTVQNRASCQVAIGHSSVFSVLKDCAELLAQLEEMRDQLELKAHPLADHVCVTLQEIMERAGATRIEDEACFDISRHQVVPARRVKTGTVVAGTVNPGYKYGSRIIKRARVRVDG
jgi:hypothetical protein